MHQYMHLLRHILDHGERRADRTGVGTVSVFGHQMRFDLREGFPLLTTKKMATRAIVRELLWFLAGDTNIKTLVDHDVKIWNEWPFQDYLEANGLTEKYPKYTPEWREQMELFVTRIKEDAMFAKRWGDLGAVYGKQWRRWEGPDGKVYDQIKAAVDQIKSDPMSRRILVSAWNVADVYSHTKSAPPLCHTLFQFSVAPPAPQTLSEHGEPKGTLSCQLYQRSADVFLGVPFNIASYSLLTSMIAQVTGLQPGEFIHTLGDAHLYLNHLDQAREQLARAPRSLPQLQLNPAVQDLFAFRFEDIAVENYDPYPAIKAPIAV